MKSSLYEYLDESYTLKFIIGEYETLMIKTEDEPSKEGTELGFTEDESLALYNMVHYKKAFENLQEQRQEIVKYLISGA